MKRSVVSLMLSVLLMLMSSSCQQEELPFQPKTSSGFQLSEINRGDGYPEQEGVPIQLGAPLTNPYQVDRMTMAWNRAYPQHTVNRLPVTHRQIKFTPSTGEQVIALEDAGIDVFTYPFGYELLNEGNYYLAPGTAPADVPVLYAVVPVDIALPEGVPYEVQQEICLLPLETQATREAFILAGLDYKPGLVPPPDPPADPTAPDFTTRIKALTDDRREPPMVRGDKDLDDYTDGDAGDAGQYATACGCFQWNNEDKPAGCVKVEDTQWGLQPLVGVRVTFRNAFFSRRTHADDHGCFQIDHDYWPGAHGFVHWENYFADVRSLDYWLQGSLFGTHCDPLGWYDLTGSTHINNMNLTYWKSTNLGSTSSSYYIAATYLNSLITFMKYTQEDGIPTPPYPLRVLLTKGYRSASAPMFTQMGLSGYYSLLSGLMNPFGSAFAGTLLFPILGPVFLAVAPDMLVGYGFSSLNSFKSDRLRGTYYHELAHSVHYRSAGNHIWAQNMEFIIDNALANENDVYGFSSIANNPMAPLDADHKRCQLIETWAYFLGVVYTHRTYGLNYSGASPIDPCENSWIANLEKEGAIGYFPRGLLQDLRDNNSDYCNLVLENPNVEDHINHGYMIREMHDALLANESILEWWLHLPSTGQTSTNMSILYNSYSYLQ